MRTVDPVVLGDVRAYVVLVGRRAEGAGEGRVLAQEVGGRTCVQVLICKGREREREGERKSQRATLADAGSHMMRFWLVQLQ